MTPKCPFFSLTHTHTIILINLMDHYDSILLLPNRFLSIKEVMAGLGVKKQNSNDKACTQNLSIPHLFPPLFYTNLSFTGYEWFGTILGNEVIINSDHQGDWWG